MDCLVGKLSIFASIYICFLLQFCSGFDRNITSFVNYGCTSASCKNTNLTLLYINAVGSHDTIHQIWDFTRGHPTAILAVTKTPLIMNIEWQEDKPFSFHVDEPLTYAFAVVINKIWEFNDLNDTAVFDPETVKGAKAIDTSCFKWNRTEVVQMDNEVMLNLLAHGCEKNIGNFTVQLDLLPFTDYSSDLPHLVHSSNSTQVDVVLDRLVMTKGFNSSRFALELLFISEEKVNGTMHLNIRKGLDDEHTPGVFEVVELLTPESTINNDGGFIQYRPVTYVNPERDVETSRNVSIAGPVRSTIPEKSTVELFFAAPNALRLIECAYVTLGSRADGFYQKSNYNLWTFTMGYGSPPSEGFSLFVILIMSIGLGIPVLLMLIGGAFVCVRKRRNANNPERLRD